MPSGYIMAARLHQVFISTLWIRSQCLCTKLSRHTNSSNVLKKKLSLLSLLHGVTEVIGVNTSEETTNAHNGIKSETNEMSGFLRSHIIVQEISVDTERKGHPFFAFDNAWRWITSVCWNHKCIQEADIFQSSCLKVLPDYFTHKLLNLFRAPY